MIVGTEWLIEASGCSAEALRNEATLRALFQQIIIELRLQAIDQIWHKFPGEGGVTGMAALTESHLTCHTYPENLVATFNLYCCQTRPEWDWETNLARALGAARVSVRKLERGDDRNAAVPAAVLSASRTQLNSTNGDAGPDRKLITYGDVNIRQRGRLPHWEKEDGIYFVTFRLADSLPQQLLRQLEFEREQAESAALALNRELSSEEQKKLSWLFSKKVDDYLDKNYGACQLKNPAAARIVAEAITHFENARYHLYAWCIMPNHVHVVFKTIQRNKLDEILHSWKSYSAHGINKLLGRTGEFWQREYYDHLVRSEKQLDRMVRYTINNPSKAGLKNWKWVGSNKT